MKENIKTEGLGGISSEVIEDSIGKNGCRLTTLQLRYPRLIHAEFMTHRVFSRNASSSRAIPVEKMIHQIRENPAMPIHWGTNKPGMQAGQEVDEETRKTARAEWIKASNQAADSAEKLMNLGLHKQVANRLTEPFQFMNVIVTATEWDNWFELRNHDAADPNIHELARIMQISMDKSTPLQRMYHLPYITSEEKRENSVEDNFKASVARCARVSYKNHDQSNPNFEKDVSLHNMLRTMGHMSPFEHQAMDSPEFEKDWSGNFYGWKQYRKMIE